MAGIAQSVEEDDGGRVSGGGREQQRGTPADGTHGGTGIELKRLQGCYRDGEHEHEYCDYEEGLIR